MKKILLFALLLLWAFGSGATSNPLIPPPVNDLCEDAIEIQCGDAVMGDTTESTSIGAYTDTCGTLAGAPGNWYTFVGTGDEVTMSLCGSSYDTKIQIFTGDCNTLVCVDGNDDFCDVQSEVTFASELGTIYTIYVFGFGTTTGTYTLTASCIIIPPTTENDLCEDAIAITCGTTIQGDTTTSTSTGAPTGNCGTGPGAPGNWYSMVGTGDIVTLSLCGSSFDTKIQVFTGTCTSLQCVTGNDDFCGLQSQVSFISQVGTNYIIYVFGFGSNVGTYTLASTCTPAPPPPPNDDCFTAITVPVNPNDVCIQTVPGTIAGATASQESNTCGGTANDDVWFTFTATTTNHIVQLLNVQGNTTDLYHIVYSGTCGSLTNVICSDPNQSLLQNLTVGQLYTIRVFSFGSTALANTTFDVCVTSFFPPPPPPNDDCDNAITVDVNPDDSCDLTTPGTIVGATPSSQNNGCIGSADDDVWFKFVATDASHTISLINITGSTTDLVHAVYQGSNCNSLTQISCSDPNFSTVGGLTIGNTYYIRIYSWTSTPFQTSAFDVCVGSIVPPQPCLEADPFCSADGLVFPNVTGGQPAPPGIDYDCLFTQPNPSWFYLQIADPGLLQFQIIQNTSFDSNGNPNGTPLDVDFIAWGPFTSVEEGCANLNLSTEVDCSYLPDAVEFFSINNAQTGEIYILLITNYSQQSGFISLQQTNFGQPGAGSTDCSIVFDCGITIDGGDQTYCDVNEVTLTTTTTGPVESYQWYKDGVLIAGETDPTLVITETGVYKVIADGTDCTIPVEDEVTITLQFFPDCGTNPDCSRVDFVEDFSTGTGRVSTPYTTYIFNEFTQLEVGEYAITNTSTGLNTGWHVGMEDHTPNDVNGRAMYVNAAEDSISAEFYRRPITLQPNTDYNYSFWITTVYDTDTNICIGTGDNSNVIYRIEDPSGATLAQLSTGDLMNQSEPNWLQFGLSFNTGTNTEIQLVMINNNFGNCGNDFAIDDLTISSEGEPPVVVTPPDLTGCDSGNGTAVFDLTVQNPIILDGQDPADFNITFHNTQADAADGINPIDNPTAYMNVSNPESIFARIERANQPTCFSLVQFNLIVEVAVDITANIPETVTLCNNDEFPTFDATPTNPGIDLSLVTYEWVDANGVVVATTATFTPTVAGTYTVTITYPPCSENSYTVEVNVIPSPIIDLGEDFSSCFEEEVFLDATPSNFPPEDATYVWFLNGEEIVEEIFPRLLITGPGTYTVIVTVGDCSTTASITVTLNEFTVSLGDDFDTCFDESAILTADVMGYDESQATFQWFLNGSEIMGETSSTLNITEPGEYIVIATVGLCTAQDSIIISGSDTLAVEVGPDVETCPNEPVVLTAITQEAGVTYQWFLNGTPIPGETGSSITVTLDANVVGSQTYTVVITRGNCTGSASVDVSLYGTGNCVISQGISPNGSPGFNDELDLSFLANRTGINKLQIFNRLGRVVFELNNYTNQWRGQSKDGNDLPTGTYFYVIDLNGNDPIYGTQATGWIYLNQDAN